MLDFNDVAPPPITPRSPQRDEVRTDLLVRLPSVLSSLFPDGKERYGKFYIGDVHGAPGDSLEVVMEGEKAGIWIDRATNEGGDIFALVAASRGLSVQADFPQVLDCAAELVGRFPAAPARRGKSGPPIDDLGPVTGKWDYQDAGGSLIVVVYRYDPPGRRKEFRPFDVKRQKWSPPEPRPLYNQPGLAAAERVVLVEGEKCAQALIDIGVVATTAMNGARAPIEKTDWSPLTGKSVLIWPDRDKPGWEYAMAASLAALAAGAISCDVLLPPDDKPDGWDAADAIAEGFDVTGFIATGPRISIQKPIGSTNSNNSSSNTVESEWPAPQPLMVKLEPEPYPVDALPSAIRAAVEEVAGFVKAPLPLVVSSALAALSLAAQAHIDIRRADRLQGPVSLNLLTIADSGERKSTCDGFFTSAIRQYQEEQAELLKPELERHKAELDAWTAERDGLLAAIKEASRKGKPTNQQRAELAALQQEKPEAPRIPHLLLGDETPENLAWRLAFQWPSAGVMSSEAGLILGAHGMGKDSAMRNLSLLNILWDGGTHSIGRRTSESFTMKGVRLTVGLQVQEATLRSFFDKSGALARGTGFLARFLIAFPESTQGYRPYSDPPNNWPHLAAFHRRISNILETPIPMNDTGELTPVLLSLSPEAKAAWVAYHDAIESELHSGGELYDVRDVASKSADNAVRIAALFQVFEHGFGDVVGVDCFESASRIAAWHLHEARRFFGELALPVGVDDAMRLDSWLIAHCRRDQIHIVGKNHVRQHGPLRDGSRLDAAIRELEALDRLRLVKDGKKFTIHLNPVLVEGTL